MTFPATVAEAVDALARTDGARPIAGGTDLWIRLEAKRAGKPPPLLVSLQRVEGLCSVELDGSGGELRIGAGVTLAALVEDPRVRAAAPLISTAAWSMASPPVRSRATIGGNLCNASPAADLAPPLLVHEALAVVAGPGGERRIAIADLLTGPGSTALGPCEIVTTIVVPRLPAGTRVGHAKHQVGLCGNLSIVSLAVAVTIDAATSRCSAARVALGAVAPTAIRAAAAEAALAGRELDEASLQAAAAAASQVCSPIDDVRASCDHRCRMVAVLLPRVVRSALAGRV